MVIKEGSSTFLHKEQQVTLLNSKSKLADLLPDDISELSEGAQERAWNPDLEEEQQEFQCESSTEKNAAHQNRGGNSLINVR